MIKYFLKYVWKVEIYIYPTVLFFHFAKTLFCEPGKTKLKSDLTIVTILAFPDPAPAWEAVGELASSLPALSPPLSRPPSISAPGCWWRNPRASLTPLHLSSSQSVVHKTHLLCQMSSAVMSMAVSPRRLMAQPHYSIYGPSWICRRACVRRGSRGNPGSQGPQPSHY